MLTGGGRGCGGSRGRLGLDGDGDAFGDDLARADGTPDGVEGDVDGVHDVGGGLSGKGRRDLSHRAYNLPVPSGTRDPFSLLFIFFPRGVSTLEIRSRVHPPDSGAASHWTHRHRSDSQPFAGPIAPSSNQSRPQAAQSPLSSLCAITSSPPACSSLLPADPFPAISMPLLFPSYYPHPHVLSTSLLEPLQSPCAVGATSSAPRSRSSATVSRMHGPMRSAQADGRR